MADPSGTTLAGRRLWLPEMEGRLALWYDRQRGTAGQVRAFRELAARLAADLPDGARLLEVAPGPGYLAIELARLGFQVTGLDVSRSFVEIAAGNARRAAVAIDFRRGDAAALPFEEQSFDLVVCQAAFKNFRQPVGALDEMHRVLRPNGTAVIHDLRKDASRADIDREVARQGLGGFNGFVTRWILVGLRRRAYSQGQFERLVARSAFQTCEFRTDGIAVEVRLERRRLVTR